MKKLFLRDTRLSIQYRETKEQISVECLLTAVHNGVMSVSKKLSRHFGLKKKQARVCFHPGDNLYNFKQIFNIKNVANHLEIFAATNQASFSYLAIQNN